MTKNNKTNDKLLGKVAFLRYTEMVYIAILLKHPEWFLERVLHCLWQHKQRRFWQLSQ